MPNRFFVLACLGIDPCQREMREHDGGVRVWSAHDRGGLEEGEARPEGSPPALPAAGAPAAATPSPAVAFAPGTETHIEPMSVMRQKMVGAMVQGGLAVACLIVFLTVDKIPEPLTKSVPYVLTLVVLASATQRLRPPAHDGKPYRSGEEH